MKKRYAINVDLGEELYSKVKSFIKTDTYHMTLANYIRHLIYDDMIKASERKISSEKKEN